METDSPIKNVLIIYPHWHPANLAGVHRPRLIGNFLLEFGFKPIVLTVKEEFYEEKADAEFEKTFRNHYEVYRVSAFRIGKTRLIGDIGLRAFVQLYKEARTIIKSQNIDFIWIPIPSFYTSLLGRMLHNKTKVPYGIDYIDPWVRDLNNQLNLRAILSQAVARILEPIAIKKASLITGVATPYYEPIFKRNVFAKKPIHAGMPYGFDPKDHELKLESVTLPWSTDKDCKPWVYAGAFLPNSHLFIQALFKCISILKLNNLWDERIKLYFLGTGAYPAKRITAYAKEYGLEDIVVENRNRYPFLHILNFLSSAERIMLIGSTERHYTASKTFQCLLSNKPLFGVMHTESSAHQIITDCMAADFLISYQEGDNQGTLVNKMYNALVKLQGNIEWNPDLQPLEKYSARQSASVLANCIEEAIK